MYANHGSIVSENAASMTSQRDGGGRGAARTSGKTIMPIAASANGKSTNAGRLSAVSASSTPSHAKSPARPFGTARSASHIDAVNSSVVQISVMTSAAKYGSGGNNATAAAAAIATLSDATRRPIAYAATQMIGSSTVCASATAMWCTPKTL